MKALHVVNISFVLPYYIGEQFDFFQEKGVKFYIASSPDPFLFDYCKEKNLKAIPVHILREINIKEDIKATIKLFKVIKRKKIDVVIGHTPKGALLAMLAATLARTTNRIYFRHGLMYETSKGLKRFVLKNIERFTGSLATKIICVSPSVLRISNHEKLSKPKKNILLNRGTCNGIDALVKFNPAKIRQQDVEALKMMYDIKASDKVVGYVGRLVNDKGINELIQAWKSILKTRKNIKLLLVGPFEKRDAIDPAVQKFIDDEPTIISTGLIQETALYYALMDLFILPSYREGFPTVVLEASSMELPVITTQATGCIDSIINNETGVFTSLKPADIVKHILYYLDNESVANDHGQNGRSFVLKNFDQHVIWREIQKKVYQI